MLDPDSDEAKPPPPKRGIYKPRKGRTKYDKKQGQPRVYTEGHACERKTPEQRHEYCLNTNQEEDTGNTRILHQKQLTEQPNDMVYNLLSDLTTFIQKLDEQLSVSVCK